MATLEEISKQIRNAGMAAEQKEDTNIDAALPGGEAAEKTREDFDPAALEKGIAVEMEHTPDRAVAENICMDHLSEDPLYYDKLEKMEENGVDKAQFARFAANPLTHFGQNKVEIKKEHGFFVPYVNDVMVVEACKSEQEAQKKAQEYIEKRAK
jgi:hypothetical protein